MSTACICTITPAAYGLPATCLAHADIRALRRAPGRRLADAELDDWVRDAVVLHRGRPWTSLLAALRATGTACEQGRFRAAFQAATATPEVAEARAWEGLCLYGAGQDRFRLVAWMRACDALEAA